MKRKYENQVSTIYWSRNAMFSSKKAEIVSF
jgi:hypothetical protein